MNIFGIIFPSIFIMWNNLDNNTRNSESASIFKKLILQFMRPTTSKKVRWRYY